jgi:hypothetical protein
MTTAKLEIISSQNRRLKQGSPEQQGSPGSNNNDKQTLGT